MGELIYDELIFAAFSFLTGVKIAAAYDALRIFRYIVKHGKILTGIEDFIFSNICGIFVFAMIFTYNNGAIRGFSFFLTVMGILIYSKTVSRIVIKTVRMAEGWLLKVLQKLKKQGKLKVK